MPRATRRKASSPVAVPEEAEVSEPEIEEVETEEAAEDDQDMEDEAVAEEVDDAEPQHAGGIVRLRFKQELNWRAGRPIAVAELLRRLEALARELQSYEQDEVAVESLQTAAKELASQQLLSHKDKGVKALTASCLVDIFRLCAPNAPYTQQQMKEIFTLLVKEIFPALADPSSAYNRQHLYVLKSLAEVKSIILLTDVPSANTLIEILFKECFDVLGGPSKSSSNEELSKNVEHHMTSVLSTLVDEAEQLPNEVTYTILAQFLRTNPKVAGVGKGKKAAEVDELQGKLLLKEAPPAYNMAKNICNASPDKMSRYITKYWGNVVSSSSEGIRQGKRLSLKKGKRRAASDDEDSEDDLDDFGTSADMDEIRKAHDLLRELWRATPNVLSEIIPLLEAELSEENVQKRQLAVETVGDMIAGIGHAGPPAVSHLNPAAYPSQSLIDPAEKTKVYDFLTTPTSPIAFLTRYREIYQSFLSRRHDKSTLVRAAWATAVGRILLTSAGGVGLDLEEEQALSKAFADTLMDVDEKVRHNAVRVIERFDYDDIMNKLGNQGGIDDAGSILANLAERAKDRRPAVRNDALKLLGKIWGVASGAIGDGSERTQTLLGSIPSKLMHTFYINDLEVNTVVDRVMFDSLLPLSYPPIKSKSAATNGESQRSQRASQRGDTAAIDPDKLRTERILVLANGLDERAKNVFFAYWQKQVGFARYMGAFLTQCEKYNGGVSDDDEDAQNEIKVHLGKLIVWHASHMPDGQKVTDDMWKFAKVHDRRSYALIRFCLAPESDYKKVKNAFFELTKKLEDMSGTSATFVDNMTTQVLRASVLVYNRSHIQSIIEFSKSDENGLGQVAHEVLEKISKDKPEVFKAHVQDLCKSLETEAPTAKRANEAGAVQDLKACAQFARQFPKDTPKDRKFIQALFGFINHGTPAEAAKYGAMIILLVADKKALYAKDILKQCTEGFEYGKGNFLNQLAALSQLMLLGSEHLEDEDADVVVSIAINDVLMNKEATPVPEDGDDNPSWTETPDEHCAAKKWAMKILVNRLRAYPDNNDLDEAAKPVFSFLNSLIQEKGQTAPGGNAPAAHQSRMRLSAAQMMLKLCREKHLSARLTPGAFNQLAIVTMDPRPQVRSGFVTKLMKHLGQNKLSSKFYTPLFLLAHEPDQKIKSSATTWLKGRAAMLSGGKTKDTVMEATFARLLSLLAHHPDWPSPPVSEEDTIQSLKEFTVNIIYFLQTVGTADNLGLVYHIAQRVKGHQDGIVPEAKAAQLEVVNERIYTLSDLAQGVIRRFLDVQGWSLQAWPGKVRLPNGIFRLIGDADTAREVATRNYLPPDFEEGLDDEVRGLVKGKKRKAATSGATQAAKKVKTEAGERKAKKARPSGATKKTPKKSRINGILSSEANAPSSEVRRSGRGGVSKSYIEVNSDDEESSAPGDEEGDEDMEDVPEDEEQEQSVAGAQASPEPDEEDEEPEVETAEPEEVGTSSPAKSSPAKRRSATRPAPQKAATPKKAAATPKKTPVSIAKQVNGSAKKVSPKARPPPKTAKAAAAKGTAPAKTNGTATRGTRASKRAKAPVDEFDVPDSD